MADRIAASGLRNSWAKVASHSSLCRRPFSPLPSSGHSSARAASRPGTCTAAGFVRTASIWRVSLISRRGDNPEGGFPRRPRRLVPSALTSTWRDGISRRQWYNPPRRRKAPTGDEMSAEHTTAAVQQYLDELAGGSPPEPLVRELLDRAVRRLHQLCASLLYRSYPRLARPPLNFGTDELLSAVVERLLKALREARPATTREFFALACRHMRWELNEMARRLDEQPPAAALPDESLPAPASTGSGLTADARRILVAIDGLPEDEREAFDLVRIQGMTQAEAGQVLGVSAATVNRRLNRGLELLAGVLGDLRPDDETPNSS